MLRAPNYIPWVYGVATDIYSKGRFPQRSWSNLVEFRILCQLISKHQHDISNYGLCTKRITWLFWEFDYTSASGTRRIYIIKQTHTFEYVYAYITHETLGALYEGSVPVGFSFRKIFAHSMGSVATQHRGEI